MAFLSLQTKYSRCPVAVIYLMHHRLHFCEPICHLCSHDFFSLSFIFFQHLPFLNLIHSKELTLTSSLTSPLLGDNRVLCAIFNFPILVPLVFSLPIPTLINMHKKVGFDPQLDTSYLMTTVLSCNSSFLSLKLIAESKRAGIDHQLDAS